MAGFNKTKKKTLKYPNLKSAIRLLRNYLCFFSQPEKTFVPLLTTLPDIEEAQDISLPDHTKMSSDDS